jgi:hypothetical protein
MSWFMDSALRHLLKHLAGRRDEDHLAAARWNIAGLMFMEHQIARGARPLELNDLPDHVAPVRLIEADSALPEDYELGDLEESEMPIAHYINKRVELPDGSTGFVLSASASAHEIEVRLDHRGDRVSVNLRECNVKVLPNTSIDNASPAEWGRVEEAVR